MSQSVFPPDTPIAQTLQDAINSCRVILIAGLPSSGKSLIFQQLTILAGEADRNVHTLQWDDARHGFETDFWLGVYPDPLPGTTHPAIRKAIGLWVRIGVARWDADHPSGKDLLIIELPVVGGRFIELLQPKSDDAEPLLVSGNTQVIVPVPTNELRARLEEFRAATHANPRNDGEAMEAAPSVVRADWLEARQLYNRWNGIPNDQQRDEQYDAKVCRAVFERLNSHRNTIFLEIDQVFDTRSSTYDRPVPVSVFRPLEREVMAAYQRLQALFPGRTIESATDGWADY